MHTDAINPYFSSGRKMETRVPAQCRKPLLLTKLRLLPDWVE